MYHAWLGRAAAPLTQLAGVQGIRCVDDPVSADGAEREVRVLCGLDARLHRAAVSAGKQGSTSTGQGNRRSVLQQLLVQRGAEVAGGRSAAELRTAHLLLRQLTALQPPPCISAQKTRPPHRTCSQSPAASSCCTAPRAAGSCQPNAGSAAATAAGGMHAAGRSPSAGSAWRSASGSSVLSSRTVGVRARSLCDGNRPGLIVDQAKQRGRLPREPVARCRVCVAASSVAGVLPGTHWSRSSRPSGGLSAPLKRRCQPEGDWWLAPTRPSAPLRPSLDAAQLPPNLLQRRLVALHVCHFKVWRRGQTLVPVLAAARRSGVPTGRRLLPRTLRCGGAELLLAATCWVHHPQLAPAGG